MPARVVREFWERGLCGPAPSTGPGPSTSSTPRTTWPRRPGRRCRGHVHDLTFVRFPELCTPDTLRYRGLLRQAIRHGAPWSTRRASSSPTRSASRFDAPARPGRRDPLGPGARDAAAIPPPGAALAGGPLRARARDRSSPGRTCPRSCGRSRRVAGDGSRRPTRGRGPRTAGTRSSSRPRSQQSAEPRPHRATRLRERRDRAATCSRARPCSRTRRATRGSASRRSKRCGRGARRRRSGRARCRRCSATRRCSSTRPTTTHSPGRGPPARRTRRRVTTSSHVAANGRRATTGTPPAEHVRPALSFARMKVAMHVGQLFQPVPGGIGRYVEGLPGACRARASSWTTFGAGSPARTPTTSCPDHVNLGPPGAPWRYELWHQFRRPPIPVRGRRLHAPSLAIPPWRARRSSSPSTTWRSSASRRSSPDRGSRSTAGASRSRTGRPAASSPSREFTRDELIDVGFDPSRVHLAPHRRRRGARRARTPCSMRASPRSAIDGRRRRWRRHDRAAQGPRHPRAATLAASAAPNPISSS